MKRAIQGFELDTEEQWVALLTCGHRQHVRHDPPFADRPLMLTQEGRDRLLGVELECLACDDGRLTGVEAV